MKLTIKELLNGTDVLDSEINEELLKIEATPSPSANSCSPDSILFLYKSLNKDDAPRVCGRPRAIVTDTEYKSNDGIPVIRTSNARRAYAVALGNLYGIDYSRLKIIAVTGTNGKTTTASLIYRILEIAGYRVGFIGTGRILINGEIRNEPLYSMTTPDPSLLYPILKEMEERCDFAVMEVSSHSIALSKIAPIRFEYGIFTNLGEDHLDMHITKEDYYQCKQRLFDNVEHGLFNMDDKYSARAYRETMLIKRSSVGIISEADAYATDISTNEKGTSFYYRQEGLIFKIESKLSGPFNVYNLLMAVKCAIDLGIRPCIVRSAIKKIDPPIGRMNFIAGDINVLIDYAHTPEALENCLNSLNSMNISKQKLTVVFGCGGDRDKGKRPLMGRIASKYAGRIIITEDNDRGEEFYSIASDIVRGISAPECTIIKDREEAIKRAIFEAQGDSLVALIGKGHEKYMIKNGIYSLFDERELVHKYLEMRKNK